MGIYELAHLLLAVGLFLVGALTNEALAQDKFINPSNIPMYCKDSGGIYQPIQRTSYQTLVKAYARNFNFRHSITNSSRLLVFSYGGRIHEKERIVYEIHPHADGFALISMKVRLDGMSEDFSGTEMCWTTFGIVNK